MNKSKKIFLGAAAVFMLIIFVVMWDMSRKTTSPYERMKMRKAQEKAIQEKTDSLEHKVDYEE